MLLLDGLVELSDLLEVGGLFGAQLVDQLVLVLCGALNGLVELYLTLGVHVRLERLHARSGLVQRARAPLLLLLD